MGDTQVHHYFGVDWEVVWTVLDKNIPQPREYVKKLIEEKSGF